MQLRAHLFLFCFVILGGMEEFSNLLEMVTFYVFPTIVGQVVVQIILIMLSEYVV